MQILPLSFAYPQRYTFFLQSHNGGVQYYFNYKHFMLILLLFPNTSSLFFYFLIFHVLFFTCILNLLKYVHVYGQLSAIKDLLLLKEYNDPQFFQAKLTIVDYLYFHHLRYLNPISIFICNEKIYSLCQNNSISKIPFFKTQLKYYIGLIFSWLQ